MGEKTSYIDYQKLVKNFRKGDRVRIYEPTRGKMSPWEGTITAVFYATGFLDVETPYGNVRFSPEEVVLVGPDRPMRDTSYSAYDIDRYHKQEGEETYSYANPASEKERMTARSLPLRVAQRYIESLESLNSKVASVVALESSELEAYNRAFMRYSYEYLDSEIKHAVRTALYWKEKGRQYSPSQKELDSGEFTCPHCKDEKLVRTNYKKHTKLYACPSCLFLIKPSDILDKMRPDDEGSTCELEHIPSGDFVEPQKGLDALRNLFGK